MGPVDTPLAAVPAHPVISFEAAVVPGHLGGPQRLLTGKQSPDLRAQRGEEGGLDTQQPCSEAEADATGRTYAASALGSMMGFQT